jgi:hypothetical protein
VTIFQITKDNLVPLAETRFDAEGIYERKDLQRVIRDHIEVLGDDLMVITEEYGGWADSNRRIDLLCLDRLANLVVVELKRSEDGGQYGTTATMVSAMTFDQMINEHASYLNPSSLGTQAPLHALHLFVVQMASLSSTSPNWGRFWKKSWCSTTGISFRRRVPATAFDLTGKSSSSTGSNNQAGGKI